jgi:peptidyl-prolyl cis-trans isomerase C/peptidyl-prolyl cis-trans isomerase D
MMRNIFRSIPTLTIALLLAFVAKNARAASNDVIAVVGAKQITMKEFNDKYDELLKQTVNPPSKELFLEDLIRYEIGVQEALKTGIPDDAAVKELVRQDYYKGLIEHELGKKIADIKVTDAEMETYYKAHPELRTSHILIEFKQDATAEQKKAAKDRATEIWAEVKKSTRPFEELVALYTDDVLSKRTGGDVGWQTNLTLVPSYYTAANSMKIGDVKGIVETQYGYHIIKLTGKHSYADANKRQIRAAVFEDKRKALFDGYFAKLKKQYPVKINKELLK